MKSFERKLFPYLMLLPMIVIFGVFLFYPALNGLDEYDWNCYLDFADRHL